MANQIVLEGERSPADVFLTGNSPGVALVASCGLLAPLGEDVLDNVGACSAPSSRGSSPWTTGDDR